MIKRVLVIALLSTSPLTAVAEREQAEFAPEVWYSQGAWSVSREGAEGDVYCVAATWVDDAKLSVVVYTGMFPIISMLHPHWDFRTMTADAFLNVQGGSTWRLSAAYDSGILNAELGPDMPVARVVEDLSHGSRVNILGSGREQLGSFSLSGSRGAFDSLAQCATTVGGHSNF